MPERSLALEDAALGEIMRAYRNAQHLSQVQVARSMGLNRKGLGAIEGGARPLSLPELKRWLKAVDLGEDDRKRFMDEIAAYLTPQPSSRPSLRRAPSTGHNEITTPMTQGNTPFTAAVIEEVAESLGLPVRDFRTAISAARRQGRQRSGAEPTASARQISRLVEEGLLTKALAGYYTLENLQTGGLIPYRCQVNGSTVLTTTVSRPEWLRLTAALEAEHTRCELVDASPPPVYAPQTQVARSLVAMERKGSRMWNAPLYRLVGLEVDATQLTICFALAEFFRYRFSFGMLADELAQRLVAEDFDVNAAISRKELLPIRQELLPDGASIVNFLGRLCGSGVMTLLAIARPTHGDFAIPIQRRSGAVAVGERLISVLPQAFHQPAIDPYGNAKLNPSHTVYRQLYEELFGGKDAERNIRHLQADWFYSDSPPLQWLRDHQHAYVLECTGIGIEVSTGNCIFATILVIRDEEFWHQYRSRMRTNWEFSGGAQGGPLISSQDPQALAHLIRLPAWDGGGLFTFLEGLKRLQGLEPNRVDLPDIIWPRL